MKPPDYALCVYYYQLDFWLIEPKAEVQYPARLHQLRFPMVPHKLCSHKPSWGPRITNKQICAGGDVIHDMCWVRGTVIANIASIYSWDPYIKCYCTIFKCNRSCSSGFLQLYIPHKTLLPPVSGANGWTLKLLICLLLVHEQGAQLYDFEPHWLISNIFVTDFPFWQFHAPVEFCSSVIVQSL